MNSIEHLWGLVERSIRTQDLESINISGGCGQIPGRHNSTALEKSFKYFIFHSGVHSVQYMGATRGRWLQCKRHGLCVYVGKLILDLNQPAL